MKSHKLMIYLTVIILYLFSTDAMFSQPQTQWTQRFSSTGNYDDYVTDMAIDRSGNVYLTGYVNVNDTDQNYVTIKYNAQGIEQWVRYYDGPDHREDKPVAIVVDDSGNVIVTGSSYSFNTSYDYLTIKYNSFGDSIWIRSYTNGLIARAMVLDNQGNVYVTGIKFGLNSEDIATIKYDNLGNLVWVKIFNGTTDQYDDSYDIIISKLNVIYVSGGSLGTGGVILRYDLNGNEFPIIIGTNFFGYKIHLDSNLNIFLGFDYNGGTATRNDIAVANLDSNGTFNWLRNYHNSSTNNNDYFKDMCLDKFGNVAVTGVSGDLGQLAWDMATVKYDTNGDTLWIKRYNLALNSEDIPNSIASDKFGNTYITGSSDSGLFAKMITIKYSTSGLQEWNAYYNNGNPFSSHSGVKIFVDTLENIYVTGKSQGNGTLVDIVTIKYSTMTNYQNSSIHTPNEFKLYQNYPNPFNPKTIINYELPVMSNVSLKVFNALGKEIKILVNEMQNAGKHESEFDGSDFSSGIYFYTLSINGIIINSKKLILLK